MLSSAATKYIKRLQKGFKFVWGVYVTTPLIILFACIYIAGDVVESGDAFLIIPYYLLALLWVLVVFCIFKRFDSTKILKKIYKKVNLFGASIETLNDIKTALPTAAVKEITEREMKIIEVFKRYTFAFFSYVALVDSVSVVGFLLSVRSMNIDIMFLFTVFALLLLWMIPRPQFDQLLDQIDRDVVEQ